ncbi:hypothetical protein AYO21_07172 [Fonsecaea monophora]|uniref:AttH domain-containing protein n=1 Tax=Fonsecaea monophora TaxID=254056 RepID=A0A177F4C7_9EURO|nr:hypothetical protein AYO21_07172 [Fonsecaea monophora]KAH0835258.1 hypothetical protein FOPE_03989 [Fonsecaea pedrosoi]OAG38666.1 hypothetical protein AYO21_07172 [Fonsecaea monophora]
MKFYQTLLLLGITCVFPVLGQETHVYPPVLQVGPSTAEFTTSGTALDGPKLDKINATSFDWWYFDAVSDDRQLQATIIMVSGDSSTLGFPISVGTSNYCFLSVLMPDQTIFQEVLLSGDATIVTSEDGTSGSYAGSGVSWTGAGDISSYVVTVDDSSLGVAGNMTLNSVAPAHYPCGPNSAGQNEELFPNVGWANAIPDAAATVELNILGQQNWGIARIPASMKSWYWGHGRVGPYSLVWFDAIATNDQEYVSGYLAKDGQIVASGCSGITVRPTGANSEYPPAPLQGDPSGFHIEFTTDEGTFVADVVNEALAWDPPIISGGYKRWVGNITGGFEGQEDYEGATVHEWFHFWLNV